MKGRFELRLMTCPCTVQDHGNGVASHPQRVLGGRPPKTQSGYEGQRPLGHVTLLSRQQGGGSRLGYAGFQGRRPSEPPLPEAPQVRYPAVEQAPRRRRAGPTDLVRSL
jgi:hypothetical protein